MLIRAAHAQIDGFEGIVGMKFKVGNDCAVAGLAGQQPSAIVGRSVNGSVLSGAYPLGEGRSSGSVRPDRPSKCSINARRMS